MKKKLIGLAALLLVSSPCGAWIAYGFQSGMSRFDVATHLADRGFRVTSEDGRQTLAVDSDTGTSYTMVYCSTPQKLYRMKFRLADSPDAFAGALQKYERRYGKPEGLDGVTGQARPRGPDNAEVFLIWYLSESETLVLTRGSDGANVEFQNVSVCW
jgi:hypothetical protein